MESEVKNYQFDGGVKKICLGLILLGVIGFIISFVINPTVGWVDFQVSSLFVVTMSISGMFMLSLGGIVQASWLTPYKRIPEAMTTFLPVGFIMMLATLGGMHSIYEWTHKDVVANDPILSAKTAWLNEPRYIATMVVIFILWIVLSTILRRYSDKMNNEQNGAEVAGKMIKVSVITMILFGLSISVAGWDWIMSVEPHWFSTIFGVNIFAGSFISGLAFITICVVQLKQRGYLKAVNENHYHDLGKWMFGMSVFWAYIWISQYLLIWYANIPEETEYFVLRHHHWNGMFYFNLCINFILPFFILMTRKSKRNPKVIQAVASIILIGHFIDLYIMIAPKVFEHHDIHHLTGFGIIQALQLVGILGLFAFVVLRSLSRRDLDVIHDPTFAEGAHLHQ